MSDEPGRSTPPGDGGPRSVEQASVTVRLAFVAALDEYAARRDLDDFETALQVVDAALEALVDAVRADEREQCEAERARLAEWVWWLGKHQPYSPVKAVRRIPEELYLITQAALGPGFPPPRIYPEDIPESWESVVARARTDWEAGLEELRALDAARGRPPGMRGAR